jgi:DNA polymerase I
MTETPGTLFLIDGSNNIYRSYYAIKGLTNSAGLATNAVYGFTQMLRKLLKEQKPDAIAVAFDIGRSTFRHEQFQDYKKDRKPMPDDLSVQVPLVREVLDGFRIPVIGIQDYEADDLIGSLACLARDRGYRVVIATSDKDFFQLVGNGILLYHTGREVLYDHKGVTEAFGLPPEKVLDVMAIWGDAIDNIPGVPGIGEKGAKSLISQFGSLDDLYEHLDDVPKASHRKALETHREQALLSRELARIKCDLTVDVDFAALRLEEPDRARLHDVFSRLEFTSLMQEYLPDQPPKMSSYRTAQTPAEVLSMLEGGETIAFHAEPRTPDGFDAPIAVSLSSMPSESVVVFLTRGAANEASLRDALATVLTSDRRFVAHDVKAQSRRLRAGALPVPARFDDVMIMSYVLNPGLPSHAFGNLVRDRLKEDTRSRKEVDKAATLFDNEGYVDFMGSQSDATLGLDSSLAPELARDAALTRIYETIEVPLIPVLAKMEERGIRIDTDLLRSMSQTMGAQIADLEQRIYKEAGTEFNINSPLQLAHILFEKLQYPVLKKTQKTKSFSTGVEVLKDLAELGYAVPSLILQHRELHKLKGTYVDALPLLVGPDSRVHTSFNQAVAATGRLSSSDPNLQNIPIRTQQGREIRRAFVADDGNVLLAADYSQVELRILAHVTQDQDLIDAFSRGADIHRATAARMFGLEESAVSAEQRRAAKTINFGVLYGMSAFRLSNELGISGTQAKDFIESYFSRYPRIQEYLDRTLVEARATGKVTTLFGRVRYIPEIHNRSFTVRGNAERMATNAPIQGTAADLLKLAMIALDAHLDASSSNAAMLLTVHDEIVIEVPEDAAEETVAIVKDTMETIYPLAVPLAVETCWGRSWYDAKE